MINVSKLFASIMVIAFVAGVLATGLALHFAGVSGIISCLGGIFVGIYCVVFVASTKVARTKGIMDNK